MIRTAPFLALSVALALSACSKAEDEPETSATETYAYESEELGPVAGVPDGQFATDVAPPPASENYAEVNEIPKLIRGRWGMVAKDCTATPDRATGLLTVSAKQLEFYESVAALGKVTQADPSRMRGTFRYSGEGQSWTQDVVLEVQDNGKTMIRRDYGPDAMPGPQKYTRCH